MLGLYLTQACKCPARLPLPPAENVRLCCSAVDSAKYLATEPRRADDQISRETPGTWLRHISALRHIV